MKRVLLVMIQPPGCIGVQALIYEKLFPFVESHGWELHFAGPAPWLFSVLTEKPDYPSERLHYTTKVSLSRCLSVRKNRFAEHSVGYMAFGALQLLARLGERLVGHDSDSFLLQGIGETVLQAERTWNFDLISGKTPDFRVLHLTSQLAKQLGKPFLAMIDDPYGRRDANGFYPKDPDIQAAILQQANAAIFMSPMTRDRYVMAGLIADHKAHQLTDSYPEHPSFYSRPSAPLSPGSHPHLPLRLTYLGMLPEWRPLEAFLDALSRFSDLAESTFTPELVIHGFLYPAARERIAADPSLSRLIKIKPMVSHLESHHLAEAADVLLVVIGPWHLDNYPSKFYEYLGHRKPLLVLGPRAHPLSELLDDLKIGLFVDVTDPLAIHEALLRIQAGYKDFVAAFESKEYAISAYSAHRVAADFCALLDQSLACRGSPSS